MTKLCRTRCLLFRRQECLPENRMQALISQQYCDNFCFSESVIDLHLYRERYRIVPLQVLADTFYMAKKEALCSSDTTLTICHQILRRWRSGVR